MEWNSVRGKWSRKLWASCRRRSLDRLLPTLPQGSRRFTLFQLSIWKGTSWSSCRLSTWRARLCLLSFCSRRQFVSSWCLLFLGGPRTWRSRPWTHPSTICRLLCMDSWAWLFQFRLYPWAPLSLGGSELSFPYLGRSSTRGRCPRTSSYGSGAHLCSCPVCHEQLP